MKLTTIHVILLIVVILVASSCGENLFASPIPTSVPSSTLTYTPEPTNTATPTKTAAPTSTPTPMYADSCDISGPSESFNPTAYPAYILNVDQAILSQSNQTTERNIFQFQSYGAASYGNQTKYIARCHDDLAADTPHRSYCAFERIDSTIHVLTDELRGEPETMKNESYLIGKEGWVRPEGGEWYQSWELTDAELESMAEAYKISPFYYSENTDCEIEEDYPGQQKYCFKTNIPKFVMAISNEEVTYVNCVYQNQGVLWVDPETSLPMTLDLSIIVAVTFSGQASDEYPYNVRINMSETYKAFNEDFSYPELK